MPKKRGMCAGCNQEVKNCTGQFPICREKLTKEQASPELERAMEDFYGEHSSADEYAELVEDFLRGDMTVKQFQRAVKEAVSGLTHTLKAVEALKVLADRLK